MGALGNPSVQERRQSEIVCPESVTGTTSSMIIVARVLNSESFRQSQLLRTVVYFCHLNVDNSPAKLFLPTASIESAFYEEGG